MWDDIDHALVNLKLQGPLEKYIAAVEEDRRSIEFEHRANQLACVAALLEMVERRADEWLGLECGVYCEVWRLQNQAQDADFLRTLRDNLVEPIRARTTAERFHLIKKWNDNNLPGGQVLDSQLASFDRAMRKLEHRWKTKLEIQAKEWEYQPRHVPTTGGSMLPPTANAEEAWQSSRLLSSPTRKPKRRRKPRVKSSADRVREARICAAIALGNRGLDYCVDVKAQGVVTRASWRSDGCPKEYPDAYTDSNPRWRELIQKEKNRYACKIKKS